uniref:Uncharacterized protein n=1 Tax=Plectus sambesii TaxID=2011161 RepID=A0A914VFU3_9BILA
MRRVRWAHLTDGRRTSDMIDLVCRDGTSRARNVPVRERAAAEDGGLAAFTADHGVHEESGALVSALVDAARQRALLAVVPRLMTNGVGRRSLSRPTSGPIASSLSPCSGRRARAYWCPRGKAAAAAVSASTGVQSDNRQLARRRRLRPSAEQAAPREPFCEQFYLHSPAADAMPASDPTRHGSPIRIGADGIGQSAAAWRTPSVTAIG